MFPPNSVPTLAHRPRPPSLWSMSSVRLTPENATWPPNCSLRRPVDSGEPVRDDRTLEGASPDQIGHRFIRPATGGPGKVAFDVLGPEGLGPRASLVTVPPNRTIQVPGSVQALRRSR